MSGSTSHATSLAGPDEDSVAAAAMGRGDSGGLSGLYTRHAGLMLATARRGP